ncbi:MAG: periplasmic heavy metal sensor [Thermodesulfobacteriota bacterium]|nr:periplasmic heavy metal sensor [Thermodesulfobacteriota bacterium]
MRRVTVFVLVCFFTLSGVSYAKGPGAWGGFKMPHGRWWHAPEIAEELDITADEQAKLDELALERERELIDLKSAVQRQELELEAILDQADFDRSACLDQFEKLLDARREVATERFGFHVEVRELLGLERYRELRGMLRDRHKDRRKGGPGQKGPGTEEKACQ